jgi:GxxExxY protein
MEDIMLKEKDITEKIIGAAIEVHNQMGPGLMESVYEECLIREMSLRGLKFARQVNMPINYKGVKLENSLRLDLLVENKVIIELKSIETILPVHRSQILTYMKLTNVDVGLLINFNVAKLTNGIERFVI